MMRNDFIIQLGHPKILPTRNKVIAKLNNIFFDLFHIDEEAAFIFWGQIPIRFKYKEDLYNNFDLILSMVWLVQKEHQGVTKVNLMTQLLFIYWEIYWKDDDVLIKARFKDTEDLFVHYADALNQHNELILNKTSFLREWKMLLYQIMVVIQTAGIEIEDGKERRKWELLQKIVHAIEGYGVFYQRD